MPDDRVAKLAHHIAAMVQALELGAQHAAALGELLESAEFDAVATELHTLSIDMRESVVTKDKEVLQ